MSENSATEEELGHLHKELTGTLRRLVGVTKVDRVVTNKEGDEEVVQETFIPSASLLAVAATFLKNNSITASSNNDMDELERVLSDRKRTGAPVATVDEAEDEKLTEDILNEIAL